MGRPAAAASSADFDPHHTSVLSYGTTPAIPAAQSNVAAPSIDGVWPREFHHLVDDDRAVRARVDDLASQLETLTALMADLARSTQAANLHNATMQQQTLAFQAQVMAALTASTSAAADRPSLRFFYRSCS